MHGYSVVVNRCVFPIDNRGKQGISTGGPSKQLEASQTNLANQEAAQAQTQATNSAQSLAQMNALTAPAISYNQGVINAANSGNYAGLIQAAGPATGAISQQAQQAQQQIRNSVPAGAGQQAALAQLPQQVASQEASTLNQTYQGALNNLTQIGAAYGGVGLQESSLSTNAANSAGSAYGAVGQEASASKASTMGFLGNLAGGVGTAIGGKGCWIAEALYGVNDDRTHVLRAYLNGPFRESLFGDAVMWLYLKTGRQVAWVLHRVPILKCLFRPFFEKALRSAIQHEFYSTPRY